MPDIYLHPCDIWFGSAPARLRTVLGSCVAVTLWHPVLHLGGMCHFMMDGRHEASGCGDGRRDGCYAELALLALHERIRAYGCEPREFEAKLFGGGRMFPRAFRSTGSNTPPIQERNIAAGLELIARLGHRVTARHLGGDGHRSLIFDVATGQAWLRHTPVQPAPQAPSRREVA